MKVSINEHGVLTIEAEDGCEVFALKKWVEGYRVERLGECTSELCIYHPSRDAETKGLIRLTRETPTL